MPTPAETPTVPEAAEPAWPQPAVKPQPDNVLFIPQVEIGFSAESARAEPPAPVRFRNTLLGELFPQTEFLLVTAPAVSYDSDPKLVAGLTTMLAQPIGDKQIDFASGSRKKGVTWFSDQRVASRFFKTAEEAIAYGSNLVTECERMGRANLTVYVCEDGQYGTGDCHARAATRLWDRFEADPRRVMQVRLGHLNEAGSILGKGTAMVADTTVDGIEYDLIIPQSAFKSSLKPALGPQSFPNAAVGAMSFSEERRTRVSYTITQWFSQEAIAADVLPAALDRAAELRATATDALRAKAYFLKHYDAHELVLDPDTGQVVEDPAEQQERHRVFELLKLDHANEFLDHPYVRSTIDRFLRTEWVNLATGGGMHWRGRQAVPAENLKDNEVCLPDLPAGRLILTRYPVRSRYDLIVVENKPDAVPLLKDKIGVVAMNHATAKLLGGDFDGDYFLMIEASRYPQLATEVEQWNTDRPVEIQKEKKRLASPLTNDNLAACAVKNMGNPVGLITHRIASAAAAGREDVVLQLAQPLEDAVVGMKYSVTPDMAMVNEITREIPAASWLSGVRDWTTNSQTGHIKDQQVFRQYGLTVTCAGTVAFLATEINTRFKPGMLYSRPLEAYAHRVPLPPENYLKEAAELKKEYGRACGTAFSPDADRKTRSRAFEGFTALLDKRISILISQEVARLGATSDQSLTAADVAAVTKEVRRNLARALWHSAHQPERKEPAADKGQKRNPNQPERASGQSAKKPSTGSFGFQMLADLAEDLRGPHPHAKLEQALINGIGENQCRDMVFTGATETFHIKTETYDNKLRLGVYLIEGGVAKKVGLLEKKVVVPEGSYQMSLTSTASGKSATATFTVWPEPGQNHIPLRDDAKWEQVREKLLAKGIAPRVVDGLHENGKLWAATMQVTGKQGQPLEVTAAVVPALSPASGLSTGALTYAVAAHDPATGEQWELDLYAFAPQRPPSEPQPERQPALERDGFVLHSPRLRAADGTIHDPPKLYFTTKLEEQLSLASQKSQEKACFVLLAPTTNLDGKTEYRVPLSVLQWAKRSSAQMVIATPPDPPGQALAARLQAHIRQEAPELKLLRALPPDGAPNWTAALEHFIPRQLAAAPVPSATPAAPASQAASLPPAQPEAAFPRGLGGDRDGDYSSLNSPCPTMATRVRESGVLSGSATSAWIPWPNPDRWPEVRQHLIAGKSQPEIQRIEYQYAAGRLYADSQGRAVALQVPSPGDPTQPVPNPEGVVRIMVPATNLITQAQHPAATVQRAISDAQALARQQILAAALPAEVQPTGRALEIADRWERRLDAPTGSPGLPQPGVAPKAAPKPKDVASAPAASLTQPVAPASANHTPATVATEPPLPVIYTPAAGNGRGPGR